MDLMSLIAAFPLLSKAPYLIQATRPRIHRKPLLNAHSRYKLSIAEEFMPQSQAVATRSPFKGVEISGEKSPFQMDFIRMSKLDGRLLDLTALANPTVPACGGCVSSRHAFYPDIKLVKLNTFTSVCSIQPQAKVFNLCHRQMPPALIVKLLAIRLQSQTCGKSLKMPEKRAFYLIGISQLINHHTEQHRENLRQ